MKDFNEELSFAKKLSIEAGKRILDFYGHDGKIERKDDDSPLTRADLAANKVITSGIRSKFPDDAILTEEEKDNKERLDNERVWIIDPMDGTKEFISKNGEFTVNIALVKGRRPVVAVIYLPAKEELFYAVKSKGTFYHDDSQKIETTNRDRLNQMTLIKSRSHASEKLMRIIDKNKFDEVLTAGSSLKGCRVAQGNADVYIRLGPTHEWDICAMDLVVQEAGGILTDTRGKLIKYNSRDTLIRGFVVSNNEAHDKILKVVQ